MHKCTCEFDDVDQDEVLTWCSFHADMRERIEKLEAERKSLRGFIADLQQLASEVTQLNNDAVERWCKQTLEGG